MAMLLSALPDNFLGWCSFGLGAVLLGLLSLLGVRPVKLLLGQAVVLLLVAAGTALMGSPLWGWCGLLGLAGVSGLQVVAHSQIPGWLVLALRRSTVQGALLLLTGCAVVGWQIMWLDGSTKGSALDEMGAETAIDLLPAPGATAVSDAGNPIPLYTAHLLGPQGSEETVMRGCSWTAPCSRRATGPWPTTVTAGYSPTADSG